MVQPAVCPIGETWKSKGSSPLAPFVSGDWGGSVVYNLDGSVSVTNGDSSEARYDTGTTTMSNFRASFTIEDFGNFPNIYFFGYGGSGGIQINFTSEFNGNMNIDFSKNRTTLPPVPYATGQNLAVALEVLFNFDGENDKLTIKFNDVEVVSELLNLNSLGDWGSSFLWVRGRSGGTCTVRFDELSSVGQGLPNQCQALSITRGLRFYNVWAGAGAPVENPALGITVEDWNGTSVAIMTIDETSNKLADKWDTGLT